MFIVEGIKEIEKAILKNYNFESVFFCSELISENEIIEIFNSKLPNNVFEVTLEIFSKIAYRETSKNLIAVATPKKHKITDLVLPENPLILVVESVEKPGNLGAIYRTADAAGINALIICDKKTDLYNPNVIRASIGCNFTVQTAITSTNEAIEFLTQNNINIYSTYLNAAIPYHTVNFKKPSAIVMGTEATGISELWIKNSNANIIIPMQGFADSMNVSTSTAVIIFEAVRQRSVSIWNFICYAK